MVIKNIWNEPRNYSDLDNLVLLPGESIDLSKFSSRRRDSCKELQNDFAKGYCICIGKSAVSSSKASFLKEARNRSLGIERRLDEIKIPPKRKTLPPKVTSLDKRTLLAQDQEQKQEPEKQEKSYRKVFGPPEKIVIPEVDKDMVIVAPNGGMTVTKLPQKDLKVIELEPFNLSSPMHYKLPKPIEKEYEPESEVGEEEEAVEQMIKRTQATEYKPSLICMGINRMGRPCNKRAVRGHKYCIKHMPEEERIDYQNKKRGTRFSN